MSVHNFVKYKIFSKKFSRNQIYFLSSLSFMLVIGVLVAVVTLGIIQEGKTQARAELSSISTLSLGVQNTFVPVIFYANDGLAPSQTVIDQINQGMGDVKTAYSLSNEIGAGNVLMAPAIVYKGLQTQDYYNYQDPYNCGPGMRFLCNVNLELMVHERDLAVFGNTDTGYGWDNRIPIVLFWGSKYFDSLKDPDVRGTTYGKGTHIANGSGIAFISQFTAEMLTGNNANCVKLWQFYQLPKEAEVQCTRNHAAGTVAHEMGHTMSLPHMGSDSVPDTVNCGQSTHNLMCPGSQDWGGSIWFPAATLDSSQKNVMLLSGYVNPESYVTAGGHFCFLGNDPALWCTSTWSKTPRYPFDSDVDLAVPTSDCCRVNYNSQRITLGGYDVEVCGKGIDRNDANQRLYGCQIKANGLVQQYSTTLQLKPLDPEGNPVHYDIYVDYQTANATTGKISWKEIKDVTALCFGATCPLNVNWGVPMFRAHLYKTGTTTGVCSGYSGCIDSVNIQENSGNLYPNFTGLPPDTYVDMKIEVQPYENTAVWNGQPILVNQFQSLNFKTPNCLNKPTAPGVPTNGISSLTGSAGSQSGALNWLAPTSWGNECGLSSGRAYHVYVGLQNPPSEAYFQPTGTSQLVSGLVAGKTFYWQVKGRNNAGVYGDFSPVYQFTTASAPVIVDTDHDGFFDNVEQFVGTNPNLVCGLNAWPPDINGDGVVTKLDTDMFIPFLGKAVGSPGYNARYNLDMDGTISILDMGAAGGYLYSKCTNPVKAPKGANLDPDVDGFKTSIEFYVGTDPNLVCGANAWPPDIDGDGSVTILDLTKIAQLFNSKIGDAKYNYRYDLNADLSINILDLSIASQYFTSKCANPVKNSS